MNLGSRLYRMFRAEVGSYFERDHDSRRHTTIEDDDLDLDEFIDADTETQTGSNPKQNQVRQAFIVGDYYAILGVPYHATQREIRVAYYRLARQYHPDNYQNASLQEQELTNKRMKLINEAYNCLKDLTKRARYNISYRPGA